MLCIGDEQTLGIHINAFYRNLNTVLVRSHLSDISNNFLSHFESKLQVYDILKRRKSFNTLRSASNIYCSQKNQRWSCDISTSSRCHIVKTQTSRHVTSLPRIRFLDVTQRSPKSRTYTFVVLNNVSHFSRSGRAHSRLPMEKLKSLLQTTRKVRVVVWKGIRKNTPLSSKIHCYVKSTNGLDVNKYRSNCKAWF